MRRRGSRIEIADWPQKAGGAWPPSSMLSPRVEQGVPGLKPSFEEGGTITAASSSAISDGAAALVLASGSYVESHKLKTRAIIRGYSSYAHEPEWYTTAPIAAIEILLKKINWRNNNFTGRTGSYCWLYTYDSFDCSSFLFF